MIVLATLAIAAAAPAPARDETCALGRAILARADTYWGKLTGPTRFDAEPGQATSLLDACPDLRPLLPPGVVPATDADREQLQQLSGPRISIIFIGLPHFADATHASVAIGLNCTGLCGGGATYSFVRIRGRWRQDGEPTSRWVS